MQTVNSLGTKTVRIETGYMLFNATFNIISVITSRSVLLKVIMYIWNVVVIVWWLV